MLPLVPSSFAAGDRVQYGPCFAERLPSDQWACVECPNSHRYTDAEIRQLFVDPVSLELMGVPLFSPAHVSADAPLPGRPVAKGERPYEQDRPYLMCGSSGHAEYMGAISSGEEGPWGATQAALTSQSRAGGEEFELSLTETGTVYLRLIGTAVTYAYVPAEYPSAEESADILSFAVVRAAFPTDLVVIDLA
ncbi:hypothetical protein [Streptomyces sp. WAC05292]|uniref:hypothetical protein n=1 Tax=Streptomyces sp. WAC05292 TaxID=2487418 RepID=UPI001C8EFAB6|nr:hypothetical protein [Streptomyces sp. WAC05292]